MNPKSPTHNNRLIHVLSLNVAGANARQHILLSHIQYSWFSVIMVQDPWWGRIGYDKSVNPNDVDIYGTVNSPNWICFIPPGNHGSIGPGVVTYVRRNISDMSAQFSDIYPFHKDTLAIDLYVKRSRTTLVNSYLHGDRFSDALNHLISNPIDQSGPVIWSGDFNLHHPMWQLATSPPIHPNQDARSLADWIEENDLTIMNNTNTPTRIGRKNQKDSIIDLTLFNSCAAEKWNDINWEATERGSAGSDHQAITWEISSYDQVEPNVLLEPEPGYIIDLECQDEWIEEYAHCIKTADLPNTCSTAKDLDRIANGILQAMSNATKKVMP
ncbi:hypothetical protein OPQ81_005381 [Rhizoctonia solani]|nr:hypothetical protein OPQ81_005381 [Rhizoctonia solani]